MSQGFTIWFTGLPRAGKTTISTLVAKEIRRRHRQVELLDGDVIRSNLSKGLGFSKEDRHTHVRRIGWVANVLSRNDVVAVVAAIAPYADARSENRSSIGRYMEVFCDAPLEVLAERDAKGLYHKALAGRLQGFTGVNAPYEPPELPELHLRTDRGDPRPHAARVLRTAELLGYLEPGPLPEPVDEPSLREDLLKRSFRLAI